MVSNAAPFHGALAFLEFSDETWFSDIAVNLNASYILGQRFARAMSKTGGGSILYTTSINALGAGGEFASYVATKAGIAGLIKVMSVISRSTTSASMVSGRDPRILHGRCNWSVKK